MGGGGAERAAGEHGLAGLRRGEGEEHEEGAASVGVVAGLRLGEFQRLGRREGGLRRAHWRAGGSSRDAFRA